MNVEIQKKIENIFKQQKNKLNIDFDESENDYQTNLNTLISKEIENDSENIKKRVFDELMGLGPIENLLIDPEVTEILVNQFDQIYFEKNGVLLKFDDHFYSEASYISALDRLSQKCGNYMNREKPFVESQLGNFRITIVFSEISRGHSLLSIRTQPQNRWTLSKLMYLKWCTEQQENLIHEIFNNKKNFLVIGGTGSGKTSFLQSILEMFSINERAVIIEDTQELHLPNQSCVSLLTRQDPSGTVKDISMDDLLKRALRLRPDRLVIGEIRGAEAKSLMMALATGHDGSFGSMHARTAHEALLRLEMLIQMGAPQWSLQSIRKLIAMTIQNIFVVEKHEGKRRLKGIYEITSVEESGLTLLQLDE